MMLDLGFSFKELKKEAKQELDNAWTLLNDCTTSANRNYHYIRFMAERLEDKARVACIYNVICYETMLEYHDYANIAKEHADYLQENYDRILMQDAENQLFS